MKEFESIRKDIQNKKFQPIYFLYGDEPYFIDELTLALQKYVLTEDEKAFNEHIFYGNDIEMQDVLLQARQFPMMSDYQLVIVKEAQHLNKQLEQLYSYVNQPLSSTILVFNYKYAKPDGRLTAIKKIKKNHVLAESAKLRDYQIPKYISALIKSQKLEIDPKAQALLTENIGEDLSRIHNEVDKLAVVLKGNKLITPEIVEKHIGISKDYNNFELTSAIATGNFKKCFEINKYFGQNPKDNSIFATLAVLFNYFSKLLIYHTLQDKSKANAASVLKVHPFFVQEYLSGAQRYPLKKVTQIISHLRETDIKAKGVGASGNVTEEQLMRELLYKIFT